MTLDAYADDMAFSCCCVAAVIVKRLVEAFNDFQVTVVASLEIELAPGKTAVAASIFSVARRLYSRLGL